MVLKYFAEWKNYRLFAEWKNDHWISAVYETHGKKWAWQHDVVGDAEDAKQEAVEVAIRDARVAADETERVRHDIQWVETETSA